jgi:hypothetical protein
MPFTQQTFLGASIRYFRGSLGWGTNPSTVTVGLVEDPKNGDKFLAPLVGSPVFFNYSGWQFAGILQSWHQDFSTGGGAPVYEVQIEDPRQVLSGVQIILNGFNGPTDDVPNLLNVYGFLEDPDTGGGFGAAGVNDAGIPWQNVRDGIVALTSGAASQYGGEISLAGFDYQLDLSGLPQLADFYRVPSATMSVLDFIAFICEAACCDYFFSLASTPAGNVIQLTTVDRSQEPQFGAIDSFIANANGASAKSAGFEFRNETTSKFVVGGPVSQMFFQIPTPSGGFSHFPENNAVWPFWGLDYNQNAIIGSGNGIYHSFSIPTRNANVFNLGDYYATDVAELTAAYSSLEDWKTFLDQHNYNEWANNQYDFYWDVLNVLGSTINQPLSDDEIRTFTDFVKQSGNYQEANYKIPDGKGNWVDQLDTRPFLTAGTLPVPNPNYNQPITYLTKMQQRNPHYQKIHKLCPSLVGTRVGIGYHRAEFWQYVAGLSPAEITSVNAAAFGPYDRNNISTLSTVRLPGVPDTQTENLDRLYDMVRGYAQGFMGQQFQVQLPFAVAKVQPETDALNPTNIILSQQPDSSAFLDETAWSGAIATNYLPGNIDRMIDNNYKVRAYARYNNIAGLDFSAVNDQSLVLSDNGKSAFLLCEVDPQAVFLDFQTQFSPRAVFKLPGPVFRLTDPHNHTYNNQTLRFMAGEMLRTFWGEQYTRGPFQFQNLQGVLNTIQGIQTKLTAIAGKGASTTYSYQTCGRFKMPDLIAVPLTSNVDQYGPWFATGADGPLSFEEDLNLVPWNFGGYDGLDEAGQAKVQSAISQYMMHEGGSIKIPGIPVISLGGALVASGPYITDINVDVGNDGVTTTYTMGTWTPHPYKTRKEYGEYIARINRQLQEARHLLRVRARATDNNADRVAGRVIDKLADLTTSKPLHKTKHSPAVTVVAGIDAVDDGRYASTVAFETDYGLASVLGDDVFENTCGGTLDTIFAPFCTSPTAGQSGIPRFGLSTVTGSGAPTVSDLNPFSVAYDPSGNVLSHVFFGATVRDSGLPESLTFDSASDSGLLTDYVRGVGLRAPVILSGWGYDTAGNPVPSGTPNPDGSIPFASGYKVNTDSWRSGPLDVRWDDSRKVWAAGSSGATKIVSILDDGTIGSGVGTLRSYKCQEYTPAFAGGASQPITLTPLPSGQGITAVGNFRPNIVLAGNYYAATQIAGQYYIDNQQVFEDFS